MIAWLAPAYQEHGWSGAASGGLLAIMALSQALAALLLHEMTGSFLTGWLLHLACISVVVVMYRRVEPASYARAMGLNESAGASSCTAATDRRSAHTSEFGLGGTFPRHAHCRNAE